MAGDEGDAPDDGSGVVTDQAPGREGAGRTFDGVDTGVGRKGTPPLPRLLLIHFLTNMSTNIFSGGLDWSGSR